MNQSRAYAHTDQAVELVRQWLASEPPWQLDRFLAQAMKEDRRLGRRDRQSLSEAVFAMVRHAGLVRAALSLAAHGALPTDYTDLQQLKQLPLDRAFSIAMARYGREAWPLRGRDKYTLGEKLGHAFADIEARARHEFPYLLVWHGIDAAWEAPLRARAVASGWSEEMLREFVAQQSSRPPLWLRLNRSDRRDQVLDELSAGYDVDYHGNTMSVIGPRGIFDLACWRNGDVEIQDYASQQVGQAVAPKPGETVWDACAGGGGKTMQLAALMNGRGAVHASDIRLNKLDEVARRAKKAGLHNVRTFGWSGEEVPALSREVAKRGGFDAVLVDVPCSLSGTWRRNPDARYRYTSLGEGKLLALQLQLLVVAAAAVRPGGRLVYATCSFRVEENEDVVAQFLATEPGFVCVSQGVHGCPAQDSDTMFVASLSKA